MSYSKILITGASGFIGSRLCEKFSLQYHLPYRALVRTFSHAARIARLGAEMVAGDLTDLAKTEAAIGGCDAVVHLAFGGPSRSEEILLAACRKAKIKRLIHMSSIAVHGPNPGPDCAREQTAVIGRYNERYSDAKARAEKLVQQAIEGGLPAVILRPTIVYGPHSLFVTRVVKDARTGVVSLINDGDGTCNVVYVDDLCDAVVAALDSDRALGRAMFISADQAVTWKEFNLSFANMIVPHPKIVNFLAADVRAHWGAKKSTVRSNITALRRLVASSEFHDQLGTVPAIRSAITWTKLSLKKALSADRVNALKGGEMGPSPALQTIAFPDVGRLIREDFRVQFSNELAKSVMDWEPRFDFAAGVAATKTWLDFTGMLEPGQ